MSEPPTEIELKLAVRDRAVFDEIAGWAELAGYTLRSEPAILVEDDYWDRPDGRLGEQGFGLRLRREGPATRFTLKGPGTSEAGLFQRSERELPATSANWQAIRRELAAAGLALPSGSTTAPGPPEWLAEAGLELTQRRQTARKRLIALQDDQPVAELALDTTTYQLGLYDVVFREIEIESLTGRVEPVLALGAALQRALGQRVEPSEQGKYSRGRALAARLALA